MRWAHIVVEGFCSEIDEGCPFGFRRIAAPCLSAIAGNSLCQHLSWADSDEREAALWVPLPKILVDKMRLWLHIEPGLGDAPVFGKAHGWKDGGPE